MKFVHWTKIHDEKSQEITWNAGQTSEINKYKGLVSKLGLMGI